VQTGQWSPWGRGHCDGYSLEIGDAFRGSVVRYDLVGQPTAWDASINTTALGRYLARDLAMGRVEETIKQAMELVLHDWELYKTFKERK
jgi:hypothetical protein